jgi:hypothetical protein
MVGALAAGAMSVPVAAQLDSSFLNVAALGERRGRRQYV